MNIGELWFETRNVIDDCIIDNDIGAALIELSRIQRALKQSQIEQEPYDDYQGE